MKSNILFFSFRVPLTIVNKAHQANQIYPYAISLIESVRTYERTLEKVIYAHLAYTLHHTTIIINRHTTTITKAGAIALFTF